MFLKCVKFRELYKVFKIRKSSFYSITSNCKVFEFAQKYLHISLQSITLRQLLNGNSGQLRTVTLWKTMKLQAIIVDFVTDCS